MDRNANSSLSVWFNNLLVISLMVIVGVSWTYLMFFRGGASQVDQNQFAKEVEARLAEHAPAIEEEAQKLAADVLPPLGKALYRETRQEYRSYLNTLENQGEVFAEHVQQIFIDAVKDQYRDYLQQHREVLAEEFPEHADEETLDQVMREFETLADRLVERYYVEEFQVESERTLEAWARFEPLESPGPDAPSLEEQLAEYWADWSVLAFTDEATQELSGN